MLLSKLFKLIVELIAKIGLRDIFILDEINNILKFGALLRKRKKELKKILNDRYDLYEYINREIVKNAQICYLEFGVFRGDSIKKWTQINTDAASRFYGFDSFEGLPEKFNYTFFKTLPQGEFTTKGKLPDLDDKRVHFIKGLFQNTLPNFLANFEMSENYLIVHIDADLYSSTLYILSMIDKIFEKNAIIIFDEFISVNHEFKAFLDYIVSFRRTYNLLATTKYYDEMAIEMLGRY